MKSRFFTDTALRQIFRAIVFATLLFITFDAAAQKTIDSAARPQSILLDEWTNLPTPSQVLPSRSAGRTRATGYPKLNPSAQMKTPLTDIGTVANEFDKHSAFAKPTLLEEKAFALINQQRLSQRLPLLEWDLEMLYIARVHSENMAKLSFFSHWGRDGKNVVGRSHEIGVTDWRAIGENLAFNRGAKNKVELAVQGWMNSQSHKKNLLNENWTRSGIGITETPDGGFYATQVFRN